MSHTGSDGSSVGQRMTREGYQWRAAAENVARGQSSPAQVMNAWMNSAGHRRNILNTAYQNFGYGNTNNFHTQVFGTLRSGSGCIGDAAPPAPVTTSLIPPATTPLSPPAISAPGDDPEANERNEVLRLVNEERAKTGASSMCFNSNLITAAKKHSDDMSSGGFMSHTGSDGSSVGQRMTREGYQWRAAAENVARGQSSPAQVMNAWMNSAGHRRNILNTAYQNFGYGNTNNFHTQVFGTLRSGSGCSAAVSPP